MRMAGCLRKVVSNRRPMLKKRSFAKCFCVFAKADKCTGVG